MIMWECPKCGREFRNKNQWHSCKVINIEELLKNKPQNLVNLYKHIEEIITAFGDCKIEALKSSIHLRVPTTFCSVMFKKDYLLVEFALQEEYLQPPVYETIKISGNRVYHRCSIYDSEDLTDKFVEKLRDAFYLIKNNY